MTWLRTADHKTIQLNLNWGTPEGREPVTAFMQAYEAQTQPVPWMRSYRLWNDEVLFEVRPFQIGAGPDYEYGILVNSVKALKPKQGSGTRGMQWLVALADEYGVFLQLSAVPYGDNKMPPQKLIEFYNQHGFESEWTDEETGEPGDEMWRNPKVGWMRKAALDINTVRSIAEQVRAQVCQGNEFDSTNRCIDCSMMLSDALHAAGAQTAYNVHGMFQTDNDSVRHNWVDVQVGGEWYVVDCTADQFNDQISEPFEAVHIEPAETASRYSSQSRGWN